LPVPDLGVFILVFVSIGIGWWLGRFSGSTPRQEKKGALPVSYYRGLNYLINEKPDQGIEAFVNALEVNSVTLDTHIALGNLMRRRGEVDRAIHIHQNLLARASLSHEQQHSAHFELARDYQKAGLLDRAERLLLDLVSEAPELRQKTLVLLTDIYDEEREWQQAIDAGQKLVPRRRIGQRSFAQTTMARRLAYYSCELARSALDSGDSAETTRQLKRALGFDRECVRAGLLEAELRLQQGDPRRAIVVLERIAAQSPRFLVVVLPVLSRCYEQLQDLPGLHRYLEAFLEKYQSTGVVLQIVDDFERQGECERAADFLAQQLKLHPTLLGMSRMVKINLDTATDDVRDKLSVLQSLIAQLADCKPVYRCDDCGFSGRQLHWQCPSCKNWGSVAPIRGLDGD
jgi:lipopolysaccharide biosynthesis regulator YciM